MVVGSELYGAVFAHEVVKPGNKVKAIEKRGCMVSKILGNLEEQAISLIGRDIYEKLIKGYTGKQ